jgi:hypothetical protein
MSAFMNPLPRKESRTNTQAIKVPVTTLIATTTSEAINVSLRAAKACGLEIARRKPSTPPSVERHTTAARGMSTIRLRKPITTPRVRVLPCLSFAPGLGMGAVSVLLRTLICWSVPPAHG